IPKGIRAAVYHRVSTLDQDPRLARGELEAWVARQGGQVVMLEEESASGAWGARPGLLRIMEAARRGEVDVVVCWKLDRWARSSLDALSTIESLADAGCRFVCTSQGLDIKAGGDAMSRLILTVLSAVATFERDLIRERTRLGMARAKAKGRRIGRPRKSATTERVRALRAEGLSWRVIAK